MIRRFTSIIERAIVARLVATVLIALCAAFTASAQTTFLSADTITFGETVIYDGVFVVHDDGVHLRIENGANLSIFAKQRIQLGSGFRALPGSFATIRVDGAPLAHSMDPQESEIAVYPNPVETTFTVASPGVIQTAMLTDIYGVAILNIGRINKKTFSIDISDLRSGFYLLELTSERDKKVIRIQKN